MPLYCEQSVSHPNMFAFLGHLQRTTVDSQADVNRLSRGIIDYNSPREEAQVHHQRYTDTRSVYR